MSELETRARRHAALGDPVRLAIVDFVRDSDRTVNAIREYVEVSSPLLSHHLDVLEDAGLVIRRQSSSDGRKRFVSLVHPAVPNLSRKPLPKDVLFVCTENSARSQLASALWSKIVGTRARSAGMKPAAAIHPLAIEVGRRRGLDLRHARPRSMDKKAKQGVVVVTVCDSAFEELGVDQIDLHWSIQDPAEVGTVKAFVDALDEIEDRINYVKGMEK